MARVIITKDLQEKINKKFKKESIKVFELLYSLKEHPNKGKLLTSVGNILIKKVRYNKKFRFYFLVDKNKIKLLDSDKLIDLLIKFIAMSDKKNQQKVINQIKDFLKTFGKQALE